MAMQQDYPSNAHAHVLMFIAYIPLSLEALHA